eukprot:g3991.t1
MKLPRGVLLLLLVGSFTACLAEEEGPLPTAGLDVGTEAEEDDAVAAKLAEAEEAGNTAAAAAREEADALEEKAAQGEEKQQRREEQATGEIEDSHETDSSDGEGADVAAAPAETEAEVTTGAQETSARLVENEGTPAEATAAAADRALGGEEEGDTESRTWRRRAAGRLDGFIHGWRGKGEDNPFKGAVGSYDALLKEHYLKMSFAQATALGVVGDTVAQRLERRWNPGQRYELKRTVHAGILNMIIDGIFTPQWYNLVDYVNDEMTLAIAFVKAIAASVFYGPFANGLFLAGARILRYGLKVRFDWAEWRRQLTICTVRDFEMWPPLHILNFWLVPKHWRPLAGHLAGVLLLAVISSTALTDAGLPLGQRAMPLMMRWARAAAERLGRKGRRASGAPPPPAGN